MAGAQKEGTASNCNYLVAILALKICCLVIRRGMRRHILETAGDRFPERRRLTGWHKWEFGSAKAYSC
jgi:hypothetical protein